MSLSLTRLEWIDAPVAPHALADALAVAPPAAAPSIRAQMKSYDEMKAGFASVAPTSAAGKSHAKAAAAKEMGNIARKAY